jgi:hypothetical protein
MRKHLRDHRSATAALTAVNVCAWLHAATATVGAFVS